MGPITLFDKSFLQSLSLDESVLFDHFFLTVLCSLFYVETLADLEKAVRQGRTPEKEVGIIADKTPEMHVTPCANHLDLCMNSLMGVRVPMDGRVPRSDGRPVKVHGQSGIVYEESPEEQAFGRWQRGEFLSVERLFASVWRKALNSLDLTTIASGMKALGINSQSCKSLEDARRMADAFVRSPEHAEDRFRFALIATGMPPRLEKLLLEGYTKAGSPPLIEFAPFAAHVVTVELVFQIALAANLISTERVSNRTDISYLFYLPFCMVFVSSDKLHQRIAPLFMRQDQTFVWGPGLKTDLHALVEHYKALPDEELAQGVMKFARTPPENGNWLVSQLWDKHLRPWRGGALRPPERDLTKDRELIKALKQLTDAPTTPAHEIERDFEKIGMVKVERSIRRMRGSFWQVPSDLKEGDGGSET